MKKYIPISLFSLALFPAISAAALVPAAQYDVVPLQRIDKGQTFNFGVVAFSKPGIAKVDFSISGQGYTGGVKSITSMKLNSRTKVCEYWVPISSSEFSGNGVISVSAKAYGKDGGVRSLAAMSLFVNATGTLAQPKAWVSASGSNSTGVVGNRSRPFATAGGAISAIQASNGGTSDGAIVYFEAGTYALDNGASTKTSKEWVTFSGADGVSNSSVTLTKSGSVASTTWGHFKDLTLKSQGSGQYVITKTPTYLWVDHCRVIGSGRGIVGSNPIAKRGTANEYFTDDYYYDLDMAITQCTLSRGTEIHHISDDAYQYPHVVINSIVDDVDNRALNPKAYPHADVIQIPVTTAGNAFDVDNIIVYGVHATNLHYQGIFAAPNPSYKLKNSAFVNNLFEMREPGNYGGSQYGGMTIFENKFDHLILWNNTFLGGHVSLSTSTTNSSFIGNVFWQLIITDGNTSQPNAAIGSPNNSSGNEFKYNHYDNVFGVTSSSACTTNTTFKSRNWPCPQWYAKAPDSISGGSSSTGEGAVADSYTASNFAKPVQSSLVNKFAAVVPIDLAGNLRGTMSDIGALEQSGAAATATSSSSSTTSSTSSSSSSTTSSTTTISAPQGFSLGQ